LDWKFWQRKSLLPGSPDRSGITVVESPRGFVQLHAGLVSSYSQLYREQPAVQAVVRFLAEQCASVPLHAYVRKGDSHERLSRREALVQLLAAPNRRTTGRRLIRDAVADAAVFGHAYLVKVRDEQGVPASLVRVPPEKVSLVRKDETEVAAYRVQFRSGSKDYDADDFVHFRLYDGVSPLEALRWILAEDRAASEHRAGYWKNAGRQSGVIEFPEGIEHGDEARKRLREGWTSTYAGKENAGKTAILWDGGKFNPAEFSPRDAEFTSGRKLTMEMVSAVYGVPPQWLGLSERNLSEAHRMLYQDTLPPWLNLLADELNLSLVPDVARGQDVYQRIWVEFDLEAKLRGGFEQQSRVLERSVGGPFLTPNEARRLMGFPDVEGGDVLFVPAGTVPTSAEETES
jgi:HK97 family phage portal protein